jgi:uncharacterized protein (TIGR02452 family)
VSLSRWPPCQFDTAIEIVNDTTLAVGARLASAGSKAAMLNFASATSPGGGFLQGARAQEESLARSSGLFACLQDHPMYEFHRTAEGNRDGLYTRYALYSPDVPVFRRDDGELLDEPWLCDILTCAAVNASRATVPHGDAVISSEMQDRIRRALHVFAISGRDTLVLGAWGCGAFRNDANMVAAHFRDALRGPFNDVFARVVFAIQDWSPERAFISPFERALGITASE